MRVVCVANNPFPYHTPILNELARLVDLHVIYMTHSHPLGSFKDVWGTAPAFAHSRHWAAGLRARADVRVQVSCGVAIRLERLAPDAVLFSSWGPLAIEPIFWGRIRRRATVMWAESTASSGLARGRFSNLVRRVILRQVSAYVANGTAAAEYLRFLGVPAHRIVAGRLPSPIGQVLGNRLRAGESDAPAGGRAPQYLFVGRLIPLKRPLELLASFRQLLTVMPDAVLTMVGTGPLLNDVTSLARQMPGRVRVLGHVEGLDLVPIYEAADILVVPSVREVWGLVVNEGLAAGLFVIATDRIGSAADLVDTSCGIVVPSEDMTALTAAMARAGQGARRDRAGRVLRADRVSGCTPAAFAQDVRRAIALAVAGGTK